MNVHRAIVRVPHLDTPNRKQILFKPIIHHSEVNNPLPNKEEHPCLTLQNLQYAIKIPRKTAPQFHLDDPIRNHELRKYMIHYTAVNNQLAVNLISIALIAHLNLSTSILTIPPDQNSRRNPQIRVPPAHYAHLPPTGHPTHARIGKQRPRSISAHEQ